MYREIGISANNDPAKLVEELVEKKTLLKV